MGKKKVDAEFLQCGLHKEEAETLWLEEGMGTGGEGGLERQYIPAGEMHVPMCVTLSAGAVWVPVGGTDLFLPWADSKVCGSLQGGKGPSTPSQCTPLDLFLF